MMGRGGMRADIHRGNLLKILISNTKQGVGSVALTSRKKYLLYENI
jgi:hypothetical protein